MHIHSTKIKPFESADKELLDPVIVGKEVNYSDLSHQMEELAADYIARLENLNESWHQAHQEMDHRKKAIQRRRADRKSQAEELCPDSLPAMEEHLVRMIAEQISDGWREQAVRWLGKWARKSQAEPGEGYSVGPTPRDQSGFEVLALEELKKRDKAQTRFLKYKPANLKIFTISSLILGVSTATFLWWRFSLSIGLVFGALSASAVMGLGYYLLLDKPKSLLEKFRKHQHKLNLIRDLWLAFIDREYSGANAIAATWLRNKKKEIIVRREDTISATRTRFHDFKNAAGPMAADWGNPIWQTWSSDRLTSRHLRIGQLQLDPSWTDIPFSRAGPEPLALPALVSLKEKCGLLVKVDKSSHGQAIDLINSLLLRLLSVNPVGMTRFIFLDPLGRGRNIAGFLHLNDYESSLISGQAWTEPREIDQQLAELAGHINTVTQKYLRDEYNSIDEYNSRAGPLAEPYRILTIVDFPVNFSEKALRHLTSLLEHGSRCGVFVIMVMSQGNAPPRGFDMAESAKRLSMISIKSGVSSWRLDRFPGSKLILDTPPPKKLFMSLIKQAGEAAEAAMKVVVDYASFLKLAGLGEFWSASAMDEWKVPLGLLGASKIQSLELGRKTSHHALGAGQTGSGKSNLLHNIISTTMLLYSPDEIQFYLIDFKKGVEFKAYADAALPHVRVVAIESDREFGLSVLQNLDQELKRRGALYRKMGVGSYPEYRQGSGEGLPRLVLIVDEFQEFFTVEDQLSRLVMVILDRLARQGRAFGFHVLLFTQTLAGYSLPRSTMDQMTVRIALQSSEADSRLILADDNPAARLLSRQGEAIYNDSAGLIEANQIFQIPLFTEENRRECFRKILKLRMKKGHLTTRPIIFEGHQPARLEDCSPLANILEGLETPLPIGGGGIETWLGEPVAIAPPVSAKFKLQSGRHLLVVTKDEEQGLGVMAGCLLGLASQLGTRDSLFIVINLASADNPGAEIFDFVSGRLPVWFESAGRRDLTGLFQKLQGWLQGRLEGNLQTEPRIFLFIVGLQRARQLRLEEISSGYRFGLKEEEATPGPAETFTALLRDGPEVGLHIITCIDSFSNLLRMVDRRLLQEFGLRLVGPMGADASIHLIDDPAAVSLDNRRMLFTDDEHPGAIVKLRPYALPEKVWLEKAVNRIRKCSAEDEKEN
jgi:S-DNA-T family DNA segregation ATPase FtsK/SpoIIIE